MPVADLESVLALQKAEINPGSLSKAVHAVAACKAGVPRVHVISGLLDEGLLAEVFTNEGVGTLVYVNEFQQIRRAMKKDIRSILNLTKPSVASEELARRTRSSIEKQLAEYYIFEIDKNPGIGRKLIQFVENKARELGFSELITLSTQAFTYFQSKGGFIEGSPDDLPPARREKYDQSGRNSKVLVKKLK
jgi:amino-acid N-acetyltransferase